MSVTKLSSRSSARSSSGPSSTRAVVPEGANVVVLRGSIRRDPLERILPSGDALLSLDLTVRAPGEAAESVPVAWFDPPAASSKLVEGLDVVVVGRIRRRFFRAGGATASRTEVEADRIIAVSSAARVAAAVHSALVDLDPD